MAIEQQVESNVGLRVPFGGSTENVFAGGSGASEQQRPWQPPDDGCFKMNVDGAVAANLAASCGGVIRDSTGTWVMGFCRSFGAFGTPSVLLAELMTISTEVEVLMSLDIPRVTIESDSLDAIRLLSAPDWHEHLFAEVIRPILNLARDHGGIVFKHVHREANTIADYLAHVGFSMNDQLHLFNFPFGECHRLLGLDYTVDMLVAS